MGVSIPHQKNGSRVQMYRLLQCSGEALDELCFKLRLVRSAVTCHGRVQCSACQNHLFKSVFGLLEPFTFTVSFPRTITLHCTYNINQCLCVTPCLLICMLCGMTASLK